MSEPAWVKGVTISLVFGIAGAIAFPYQDKEGAKDVLEKTTDLKNITIKDERDSWLVPSCGKGDLIRTRFTATNTKGQEINGTVCKGLFKGNTIRFD